MYLEFFCINSIVKFPYLSTYLLNIYPKTYLPNLNSILGTPTLLPTSVVINRREK